MHVQAGRSNYNYVAVEFWQERARPKIRKFLSIKSRGIDSLSAIVSLLKLLDND